MSRIRLSLSQESTIHWFRQLLTLNQDDKDTDLNTEALSETGGRLGHGQMIRLIKEWVTNLGQEPKNWVI